jgi:AraC-like DNA-binding protein
MEIFWHPNPLIDSIFRIPTNEYSEGFILNLIGSPTIHEYIILNDRCTTVTFRIDEHIYTFNGTIVCGKFTQVPKIEVKFNKRCEYVTVIRINPCGMFALTDESVASLVNRVVSDSVIKVTEEVKQDIHTYIDALDQLMDSLSCHPHHTLMRQIIRYVNANFAELPRTAGKTVAEEFAISESTLRRYFKKYVGITLSNYMITIKRKKMIQAIYEDNYDSLTVQENGYYDQSHFINDFKRLFGFPLKQYYSGLQELKNQAPELIEFLSYCNNIESDYTGEKRCYPKRSR